MREKQPSIEERILDIEMKMAETGPWPADFPASSEELAQFVRAVVEEMVEEKNAREFGNAYPEKADLAERLAREAAHGLWVCHLPDSDIGISKIINILLPLFREAVNGKRDAEGRG
jgi:hypothetical protein